MIWRAQNLPLFLQLAGIAGLVMLIPWGFALAQEDYHTARSFLYSAFLLLLLVLLVAIATSRGHVRSKERLQDYLLSLLAAYLLLPAALALPFYEALRTTSFINAYLEMVSCLTTTGLILFENPERLPDALHLWRALVGWLGGLMMWIAAVAVFSPLNLGGFEVSARSDFGEFTDTGRRAGLVDPARRWRRTMSHLAPIYLSLTAVLWLLLLILGETPLAGLSHAMSVLATSGISAVGGMQNAGAGFGGEILIFLFMFFALSRETYATDLGATRREGLLDDPEFRFGVLILLSVPTLLFARHWIGAIDVNEQENLSAAVRAAWGALFTVLSFLSTTGFESASWEAAQDWSGLGTPGLILLGLAMIGGGVATTAGGVKLLRVYALYLQGLREMERLVHPSSVSGSGQRVRRIRRKGALIAWVFFMLFALSLAAITLALTAGGTGLEDALVLSIAALSTTGPLVQVATDTPIDLLGAGEWVKSVLCLAMVLGRLETLAIIALLSPNLWRN